MSPAVQARALARWEDSQAEAEADGEAEAEAMALARDLARAEARADAADDFADRDLRHLGADPWTLALRGGA